MSRGARVVWEQEKPKRSSPSISRFMSVPLPTPEGPQTTRALGKSVAAASPGARAPGSDDRAPPIPAAARPHRPRRPPRLTVPGPQPRSAGRGAAAWPAAPPGPSRSRAVAGAAFPRKAAPRGNFLRTLCLTPQFFLSFLLYTTYQCCNTSTSRKPGTWEEICLWKCL